MNPFKNISIFRDQICNCLPWRNTDTNLETTPFPDKTEYDLEYKEYKELYEGLKGDTDYAKSQLMEVKLLQKKEEALQQENDRLSHLTTVLIEHIWKKHPFPLKEIDEKMLKYDKEQALFDDGGMDGTPRNV